MAAANSSAAERPVPVNPQLPAGFDGTPNEERPDSHREWWGRPFIVTETSDRPSFRRHWPEGVRYDVKMLDGGAWDRPTWHGSFPTLEQAVTAAEALAESAVPY